MDLRKLKYKISYQLPALRIPKRVLYAMSYYNKKYPQVPKWAINSKETANYTYDLTGSNILYLASTISEISHVDRTKLLHIFNPQGQRSKGHSVRLTALGFPIVDLSLRTVIIIV